LFSFLRIGLRIPLKNKKGKGKTLKKWRESKRGKAVIAKGETERTRT
jgi:hypothetical protein